MSFNITCFLFFLLQFLTNFWKHLFLFCHSIQLLFLLFFFSIFSSFYTIMCHSSLNFAPFERWFTVIHILGVFPDGYIFSQTGNVPEILILLPLRESERKREREIKPHPHLVPFSLKQWLSWDLLCLYSHAFSSK